MKRASSDRAKHLIRQQGDRCFLMITDECRERDGAMAMPGARRAMKRLPKPERRAAMRAQQADTSMATVEHIWPQARRLECPLHVPRSLVVIACRACNNAKGGRLPTPDELDRALTVNAKWYAKHPPAL